MIAPQLNVRRIGADGPLVTMVHGLVTGSLASWYLTVAPRLAASRRVLLYDLRGHGRSADAAGGYDLATQSDDLARVIAGEPRTSIVGHSYGALVGLTHALRAPGGVERLVLVDPPLASGLRVDLSPESVVAQIGDPAAPWAGGSRAGAPGGRAARRLLARKRTLLTSTTLLADLAAEPAFDARLLAEMPVEVLAVFGEASMHRPASSELVRIPGFRIETIAGGHELSTMAMPALTAVLDDFLPKAG